MIATCWLPAACLAGLLAAPIPPEPAAADQPQGPARGQSATDEALRDALDDSLFDELGEELMQDEAAAGTGDESQDDAQLRRALETPEAADGDEQILQQLGKRMREVEELIARRQAGSQTQQMQQKIVEDLDRLIAALRRKRGSSSNASSSSRQQSAQSSGNPQRSQSQGGSGAGTAETAAEPGPSRESSGELRKDRIAQPDPAELRARMKDLWGHLPERARELMLQSSVDQFLPKYQLLIEEYFRRLVEEQSP